MSLEISELNHVNVTVPPSLEAAAKLFYGSIMGLQNVPKPEGSRQSVGAWYQLGSVQLHLSVEAEVGNHASGRHVCYVVTDINRAELHFRDSGIEIIPDDKPVKGWPRFYVRDPGGNLIEIAQNQRQD